MTPSPSRRSFRIVVFSAIAVCAWTGLVLAISAWILRPAGSLVWPGLIIVASLAAAAGSIWVLLRAEFGGWRQAQRELVRDSRQLDLLAEAANIGLWEWDPKTNEVIFSDQWRRQIGYTEAGVENHLRAWLRLVHPEDEPRLRAAFHGGRCFGMPKTTKASL